VTPSNVTGIIDRLVEQGLVSRMENPEDRRMLILQLTHKGENLIGKLRGRRVAQISSILESVSEDELETIARGYALMHHAIESFEHETATTDKN
jgi:MarR family transcriptional regulator, organic hydroperoxide resistance regulator